jgi:glycosyltransferase involved in cell wall biosynthesis
METEKATNKPMTTIIVPAYNEEQGISVVLEKLSKITAGISNCEIIVVDDGSSDATAAVAGKFGFKVIRHEINKGKGEAVKTGINAAGGEKVIWIDADDSYPAEFIPQMIESLDQYDIVVCSRKYGQQNIPCFNRIGNFLFRSLIRGIYGYKPYDPCSGLYGAKKHQLVKMNISARRFSIEPEISMKAGRMKLKMLDIPVEYRSRLGETKLNSIKVGFEDMWAIDRHLFWFPRKERYGK